MTDRRRKHGARAGDLHTPEHEAWQSMLRRCYTPSCRSWIYYGAKGATVCDAWRKDFVQFRRDVGRRPGKGFLLMRLNKQKPFQPGNVRWGTRHEAGRMRLGNVFYTIGAVRLCLADWASRTGINKSTLHYRLDSGLSMAEATALGHGRRGTRLPTPDPKGKTS